MTWQTSFITAARSGKPAATLARLAAWGTAIDQGGTAHHHIRRVTTDADFGVTYARWTEQAEARFRELDEAARAADGGPPLQFAPEETPTAPAFLQAGGLRLEAKETGVVGNGVIVSAARVAATAWITLTLENPSPPIVIIEGAPPMQSDATIRLEPLGSPDHSGVVEVLETGSIGAGTFRYSLDGGAFSAEQSIPTSPTNLGTDEFPALVYKLTLPNGARLVFDDVEHVAGKVYTWTWTNPFRSVRVEHRGIAETWPLVVPGTVPHEATASDLIARAEWTGPTPVMSGELRGGVGASRRVLRERLLAVDAGAVALQVGNVDAGKPLLVHRVMPDGIRPNHAPPGFPWLTTAELAAELAGAETEALA